MSRRTHTCPPPSSFWQVLSQRVRPKTGARQKRKRRPTAKTIPQALFHKAANRLPVRKHRSAAARATPIRKRRRRTVALCLIFIRALFRSICFSPLFFIAALSERRERRRPLPAQRFAVIDKFVARAVPLGRNRGRIPLSDIRKWRVRCSVSTSSVTLTARFLNFSCIQSINRFAYPLCRYSGRYTVRREGARFRPLRCTNRW